MAKDGQQRKTEARERARIRREQERRRARQRKIFTYTGVIVVVLGVIAAIVIVGVVNKKSDDNIRAVASPAVVSAVAGVPAANLDVVGVGPIPATAGFKTISNQPPLTADGKPEVLYIGGEFCPHCAIERWSMAIALARFGTFTGLETTRSAPNDGDIATLTFLNTKYTSNYVTFTPVEARDRQNKSLQELTDGQQQIVNNVLGGSLSFPFIDFGNKYYLLGGQVNFQLLSGMDADEIAQEMSNPSTDAGKAIMGSANVMTAAICALTNNQPAAVCSSSAAKAGAPLLTSGK